MTSASPSGRCGYRRTTPKLAMSLGVARQLCCLMPTARMAGVAIATGSLGGDVLLVGKVVGISLVLVGIEVVGGGCRRSTGLVLTAGGSTAAIAVDVHLEDGGVVDEAVDCRDGYGLVGKELLPNIAGWLAVM